MPTNKKPAKLSRPAVLAVRKLKDGSSLAYVINNNRLIAVHDNGKNKVIIPAERIKYVPTVLVDFLSADKKGKYTDKEIKDKKRNFIDFLKTQSVDISQNGGKVELAFSYSSATYWGQIGAGLTTMGASWLGGPVAGPIAFSAGMSMFMYAAFQPCQDLNWGSFMKEGIVGGATSAVTLGIGDKLKGVRDGFKTIDSVAGRQARHFALNGAKSVAGRVTGGALKAVSNGDPEEFKKAVNPKALASTAIAGGVGGFTGAVVGKHAGELGSIEGADLDEVKNNGQFNGLMAGAVSGGATGTGVNMAWNAAKGDELFKDAGEAVLGGVIAGGAAGSSAGAKCADKYYKPQEVPTESVTASEVPAEETLPEDSEVEQSQSSESETNNNVTEDVSEQTQPVESEQYESQAPEINTPKPMRHDCLELSPRDYARINEWVYDKGISLPDGVKVLDIKSSDHIRYAYLTTISKNNPGGINIFVIRGTDNGTNGVVDFRIGLNGGAMHKAIERNAKRILGRFEDEYGPCHTVTGHSLGGRIAEAMTNFRNILAVTFNSFLPNKSSKVVSFRHRGDIAGLHKSYTDHYVGKRSDVINLNKLDPIYSTRYYLGRVFTELRRKKPRHAQIAINPLHAHSIETMVRELKNFGWNSEDHKKVSKILELFMAELESNAPRMAFS